LILLFLFVSPNVDYLLHIITTRKTEGSVIQSDWNFSGCCVTSDIGKVCFFYTIDQYREKYNNILAILYKNHDSLLLFYVGGEK
jgi:hypothetical protein